MMNFKAFFTLLLVLPFWVMGGTFEDLSPEELKTLKKGEMVLKTVPIKGSPWPKIQIFSKIKTSPFDAMAIFLAYDHQKNYVPDILESTPIKQPRPEEVWVRYVLDIPWPLPNSEYIHSHFLEKKDQGFRVVWKMEKSDTSEFTEGSAYFVTKSSSTYLIYSSEIRPKSIFAGFVKKFMVNDTLKAVKAIKSYIEKASTASPQIFKKYQNYLKLTLEGQKVYSSIIEKNLLKMKKEKEVKKKGQRAKDR